MDHKDNQPMLCSCGFFANPQFQNMCSKCYKDSQASKQEQVIAKTSSSSQPTLSPPLPTTTTTVSEIVKPPVAPEEQEINQQKSNINSDEELTVKSESSNSISTAVDKQSEEEDDKKPVQKNKDRCFSCRQKLTIAKQIANKCRCDLIFCDSHKQPSQHDCQFDHLSHGRSILSKKNSGLDEQKGGSSFTRI